LTALDAPEGAEEEGSCMDILSTADETFEDHAVGILEIQMPDRNI
jgi:antitoxin component HigA of HigAB toxin-antitoxin module